MVLNNNNNNVAPCDEIPVMIAQINYKRTLHSVHFFLMYKTTLLILLKMN